MQKDDNWRKLDQEVKKLRDKLKNEYFKKKADAINLASEARRISKKNKKKNFVWPRTILL